MKLVIAATGASGAIYLQRLLEQIDCAAHEVHLVLSGYAREVAKQELDHFKIPPGVLETLILNGFFAALFVGSALLFRYAAREQLPAGAGLEAGQ